MKYNVKQACIFHIILIGIPSSLILSVRKQGVGVLLDRKKSVKSDKGCLLIIPRYKVNGNKKKHTNRKLSTLVLISGATTASTL